MPKAKHRLLVNAELVKVRCWFMDLLDMMPAHPKVCDIDRLFLLHRLTATPPRCGMCVAESTCVLAFCMKMWLYYWVWAEWTKRTGASCPIVIRSTGEYHLKQRCNFSNSKSSPCCNNWLFQIKSNQINFIYTAHNCNHIASVGFTISTVNNILCP